MIYFKTDRLIVRNFSDTDLSDFVAYRSDPEIVKYQDFDTLNASEARAFLSEQSKRVMAVDDLWTQLAVVLKSDDRLIGDCAVKLDPNKQAHIGVTISRDYQKKGFAGEVLVDLFSYLKSQFDVETIVGIVDSRNESSNALMKGLGFELEKTIDEVPFKGSICSELYYRLPLR